MATNFQTFNFPAMRIPYPPARTPGEGNTAYGFRLVVWYTGLEDDCATLARCEVAELEALHCGLTHALTLRSVLDKVSTPASVYDRLENLRRFVTATLQIRRSIVANSAPEPPAPKHDDHPNLGPMAPLDPVLPGKPPAGHKVQINF